MYYLVRKTSEVDPEEPPATATIDPAITYDPLVANFAYGSSGLVQDDLIKRSGHDHLLFKTDNKTVYSLIEQAAQNSIYLTKIKPFENRKDGRGAWQAILSSHVGKDQWEIIEPDNFRWLMTAK